MAVPNVLTILFVLLDLQGWSVTRVKSWADNLIMRLDSPAFWLTDMSLAQSRDDALAVVSSTMRDFGLSLPDNVADLMVGIVLLRHQSGELSGEDANAMVFDIADAYEMHRISLEMASGVSLDDEIFVSLKQDAEDAAHYMVSDQLIERDRRFLVSREN